MLSDDEVRELVARLLVGKLSLLHSLKQAAASIFVRGVGHPPPDSANPHQAG